MLPIVMTRPHAALGRNPERLFDRIRALALERADVRAEAVRVGRQQQSLDQAPIVEDLQVMPFGVARRDDDQRHGRAGRSAHAPWVIFCLDLRIAHDDQFGRLIVAGAARPASNVEDVVRGVLGDGLEVYSRTARRLRRKSIKSAELRLMRSG